MMWCMWSIDQKSKVALLFAKNSTRPTQLRISFIKYSDEYFWYQMFTKVKWKGSKERRISKMEAINFAQMMMERGVLCIFEFVSKLG